jgi:DNA recombination protein RmuC
MILLWALVGTLILLGFLVMSFLMVRLSRSELQSGFGGLRDTFDSLQKNLLLSQKEAERSHDLKASTLRTELTQELQANRRELQQGLSLTTNALELKVTAIDAKLDKRLTEMAAGVQNKLEQNVKEGFRHFEKVQEHLKQAEIQLINLNAVGASINDLNNLLKLPHLRGSFGEASLERLLSDMLPTGSYELQYKIGPNSTDRVDAIVKYPTSVLPIDSKFPREQVLPLFETENQEQLEVARKNLLEVMKVLGRQIREKYIHPEWGTTEMALLFVPSETLYFEVLKSPKTCDELARNKVFIVSPNTLAVTLHAISIARNYYDMAKGVEKTIQDIQKAKQHFENFERKYEDIGTSLVKAQTAYNTASTHLSRYESAVTRLTGNESPLESVAAAPAIRADVIAKELPS